VLGEQFQRQACGAETVAKKSPLPDGQKQDDQQGVSGNKNTVWLKLTNGVGEANPKGD
jgi:hypothetical protein